MSIMQFPWGAIRREASSATPQPLNRPTSFAQFVAGGGGGFSDFRWTGDGLPLTAGSPQGMSFAQFVAQGGGRWADFRGRDRVAPAGQQSSGSSGE
ncbi:hypothetical protein LOS78_01875 [Paracoccus sp. MA]|uniref:hypothetical protein n=1 Tax=Paracoccus sp. MA TaxID=2895796 RepID=UPI001E49484C|nr:hypothetical protein [Paracoccus sp. MA]UFM64248.1 hypothetical protein LOS78_01875 [Paracoccus sp. MA]